VGNADGSAAGFLSGGCIMPDETHVPVRPQWTCRCCGLQWPCLVARVTVASQESSDVALRQRMATHLHEAAWDLGAKITPEQLWQRFLAWTEQVRRERGQRRNAVIGRWPVDPDRPPHG
jgi:hypothetical protein